MRISDSLRTLAFFGALAAATLTACDGSAPGTPVAADALCSEVAAVVCEAESACFPRSTLEDCAQQQRDTCDAALQPLIDDARLGYDALRAGAFLTSLRQGAEACWEAPVDYDSFLGVFAGTGAVGADCTPARTDAASLRASALSCADGAACRLYLRADASREGVCEVRRDSACSHAFDCRAGEFCSLPASWQVGVWGDCRPLRTDGWTCGGDLECASRHCDGTCAALLPSERPLSVPYADVVLDAAPVAYLRFTEGGAQLIDASGHGHTGERVGGAAIDVVGAIDGDTSGALRLSGDAQYVRLAPLDALAASGEVSLECWFRRDDTSAAQPILGFSDGAALGPHLWNHETGDKLYANFVSVETGDHTVSSGEGVVQAGAWHHAVATFDGSVGRLYLDGARIGETSVGDALRLDGDLYIGFRAAVGDAPAVSFAGSIDEVAVYDHALDASTIRRHRNAGVAGTLRNEFPLFSWLAP